MEDVLIHHHYHVINFEDIKDAAAFLAALSRFRNYPQEMTYQSKLTPGEAFYRRVSPDGPIEIILSKGAWNAVTSVFTPFPATSLRKNESLPADTILIFRDH